MEIRIVVLAAGLLATTSMAAFQEAPIGVFGWTVPTASAEIAGESGLSANSPVVESVLEETFKIHDFLAD